MKRKLSLSILFCFICASNVFAAGVDNPFIGLRGVSLGTAFVGIADNPSAIYYNAAGLTQLPEGKISIEATQALLITHWEHDSVTGEELSSDNVSPPPSVFVATKMGNFGIGIGFYAAHGAGGVKLDDVPTDLYGYSAMFPEPQASVIRGYETGDLEAGVAYFANALTISAEITPKFSVGLTGEIILGYQHQEFTAANGELINETEYFSIAGTRVNMGFLYKATPDLRLGLMVKGPTTYKMNGKYDSDGIPDILGQGVLLEPSDDQDVMYIQEIPWYINWGFSYQISKDLLVTYEFDWKCWTKIDDKLTDDSDSAGYYGLTKESSNWHNQIITGGGVEYRMLPITLRGGFTWIQEVLDEGNINYGASNEIPLFVYTLGGGYNITETLEIAASCSFAIGNGFFGGERTNNDGEDFRGHAWFLQLGVMGSI